MQPETAPSSSEGSRQIPTSMLLTAIPQQHHEFVEINADDFTIDVALVHLQENENPSIAQLVECIPDIRKPTM